MDYLKIDPSFQGVNRFDLILLSFEDNVVRTGQTEYFLLKVEIKNNNVIKNNQKIYENIEKTASGQWDNYITGCLWVYPCIKKTKLITVDLSKQQALDADLKAMQQINFSANMKIQQSFLFLRKLKKLLQIFHKE